MAQKTDIAIKRLLRSLVIDLSMKTKLFDESIFSIYKYMFDPTQLIFFTKCLAECSMVSGCFAEIGCAYGWTTAFLKKFMDENQIEKNYYAIDTFKGFLPEHSRYEVERRNKDSAIQNVFSVNKRKWFEYSLMTSNVTGITVIETDATKFDFNRIGPIAFALLDLALYLPTLDVLPKLYSNLSPGGIILVDDCLENNLWDGSFAAYSKFVAEADLTANIVLRKIGIIRKIGN